MFPLTNTPAVGARLYSVLIEIASEKGRGVDAMRLIQMVAGVLVETALVFDEPDEALNALLQRLCERVSRAPRMGDMQARSLPPAHVIDLETERGRSAAREVFVEWMDCEYQFVEMILDVLQCILSQWEDNNTKRDESLRLIIECALRCMAFEISAQELCDVVIDTQIKKHDWPIDDCITGLSAMAGVFLGHALGGRGEMHYDGAHIPDHLYKLSCVMTQEAVRLGVPAGSDWRFGLPANDTPPSMPQNLIEPMVNICSEFFRYLRLHSPYDQAVACAKAAGRMLAVASGGAEPEIESVIAKPLAMAAISEAYKAVCVQPHQMIVR